MTGAFHFRLAGQERLFEEMLHISQYLAQETMQMFKDPGKRGMELQMQSLENKQEFEMFEQQKDHEHGWDRMSKEDGKEKESEYKP